MRSKNEKILKILRPRKQAPKYARMGLYLGPILANEERGVLEPPFEL